MSGVLLIDSSTSTVNGALWNTASVCMVLRVNLPRETSSRTLKTACHNIPNSSRHPRLSTITSLSQTRIVGLREGKKQLQKWSQCVNNIYLFD